MPLTPASPNAPTETSATLDGHPCAGHVYETDWGFHSWAGVITMARDHMPSGEQAEYVGPLAMRDGRLRCVRGPVRVHLWAPLADGTQCEVEFRGVEIPPEA